MSKVSVQIKVKRTVKDLELPQINEKGDWIDLRSAEDVTIPPGEYRLINLGVAIQVPKGMESIVAPRSSTFSKFGVLLANSIGVIDQTYCGDNDVWRFPAFNPTKESVSISKNDRICQFRVQLSQFADYQAKMSWLQADGVEIVEVEELDGEDRGGIGSTGHK